MHSLWRDPRKNPGRVRLLESVQLISEMHLCFHADDMDPVWLEAMREEERKHVEEIIGKELDIIFGTDDRCRLFWLKYMMIRTALPLTYAVSVLVMCTYPASNHWRLPKRMGRSRSRRRGRYCAVGLIFTSGVPSWVSPSPGLEPLRRTWRKLRSMQCFWSLSNVSRHFRHSWDQRPGNWCLKAKSAKIHVGLEGELRN